MKYKQRIKLQSQRFLVQRYLIFFLGILNQAPIWRQFAAFSPSFHTTVILLKKPQVTARGGTSYLDALFQVHFFKLVAVLGTSRRPNTKLSAKFRQQTQRRLQDRQPFLTTKVFLRETMGWKRNFTVSL